MRIDILTLFPEMFSGVLSASILGRAAEAKLACYHLHDIRDFADNKHGKVDDRPFGGGPGMVMMCEPLHNCVLAAEAEDHTPATRILLTPQGRRLVQKDLEELAGKPRLLLIAGHYEGVDERVIEELQPRELSIGDYVLSGGEIPAMALIDGVVRLLPGVLGHEDSAAEDSFAVREMIGTRPRTKDAAEGFAGEEEQGQRLLDCPHYTRPRVWRGREVPDVLLSGDHQAVAKWRMESMLNRTRERRPDMLGRES